MIPAVAPFRQNAVRAPEGMGGTPEAMLSPDALEAALRDIGARR